VRLTNYLRRRLHAEDRAEAIVQAGQRLAGTFGRGPAQAAAALLAVLALAFLVGSRHLFSGRLPAVGELAPFPRATTLLAHYFSGWRTTGLGSSSPAPTAFAALGLAGLLFLGKVALLQKVLVLGAWPVAAFGIWRLTKPFASSLPRLVSVVAYAAVPLPYDSLARGRWSGLLAWAAVPWLLAFLVRLSGLTPFGAERDRSGPLPATRARTEVLKLALLLAAVGALVPSVAVALLVAALGALVASLLVGGVGGTARMVGAVVVASLGALVLHLPWSLDLLSGTGWTTVAGVAPDPARATRFDALLRFQVGPIGAAPLGWAILLAAALPLAIGQGWRFAWAARLWGAALACVLVAWAGQRGWIPVRFETPDVLLAPAALAFALAAALGAAAFDNDLAGYRFGWRQLAVLVGSAAVVAGVLPVIGDIRSGQWELPSDDVAHSVAWMKPLARQDGAFRVLWVGDPRALPLDGWRLGDALSYATSRNGAPELTDLLPGSTSGATRQIAKSLQLAERGDTARLGRLLAPMGVRYIVVPVELATGVTKVGTYPVPAQLSRALVSQIDLRLLPSDPGIAIYENASWGPARQALPDRLAGPIPETLGGGVDVRGATPVLRGGGPFDFTGTVPSNATVLLAETPSPRWQLSVAGDSVRPQKAYGVANAYRVATGGHATLRFQTPVLRYGAILLQVALWAVAVRLLLSLRRRAVELETLARTHP
jgi:hypothetical protein